MKFGTDVSLFVLKPKFEGDIFESHVTVGITLFCKNFFSKNVCKLYIVRFKVKSR